MPRITPEVVAEVKARASEDLSLLAQEWGMTVKKDGKHHTTLCIFHADKNPSMSLLDHGFYCHACGEKGSVLRLGMEQTGKSFPVLVRELAQRYNITIVETEEEKQERLLQDQLTDVLASAANWYASQLRQSDFAQEYVKSRSLTDEDVQVWQIGYAPSTGCVEYLLGRYPIELIERAGLCTRGEYGRRDFFRDRLMFPITSEDRVVGFGGRALYEHQKGKYKNSPEGPLFKKSQVLYGLDQARRSIRASDEVVLVEGYIDVIAAHRNGMTNVIAALGTAVGDQQIRRLLRLTTNFVSGFDGDQAGSKAADRTFSALEPLSYAGKVNLSVLSGLKGGDLDEHFLVSSDRPGLTPWLNWKYCQLIADSDLSDPIQFQAVVSRVSDHLGKITNPTTRSFYLRYCAEELSGGDRAYAIQLEKDMRRALFKKQESTPVPTTSVSASNLLWIYLNHPEHRALITLWIVSHDFIWKQPEHRQLWTLIQDLEEEEEEQDLAISVSQCAPDILLSLQRPEIEVESSLIAAFEWLAREQQADAKRFLLKRWVQNRNPIVVDITQGV